MPLTYEIGIMNPRPLKRRSKKRVRKSRASGGPVKLKRNSKGRFMKRGASGGPRRRRRRHAAAAAPTTRRRRRRHARRHHNPRRRRASRHVAHRVIRRRRRRNPRGLAGLTGGRQGVVPQVIAGGIGAAGALGLDVVLGYASGLSFYPDALKTGMGRNLVRLGGAIGLGMVAGRFLGRKIGGAVALGGLTVVLYSVLKEMVAKAAPTLPGLGDYEDMQIGYLDAASVIQDGTGAYLEQGAGAYMDGVDNQMEGAGAYMEF